MRSHGKCDIRGAHTTSTIRIEFKIMEIQHESNAYKRAILRCKLIWKLTTETQRHRDANTTHNHTHTHESIE